MIPQRPVFCPELNAASLHSRWYDSVAAQTAGIEAVAGNPERKEKLMVFLHLSLPTMKQKRFAHSHWVEKKSLRPPLDVDAQPA